jgi:hypothetical protein
MEYGVVNVAAAPVRRKARHQSEMTNQLLFGETVKVLKEKREVWLKVQSIHDGYEGWMTRHQLIGIDEATAKETCDTVSTGLFNLVHIYEKSIRIPFGASLPRFADGRGVIAGLNYSLDGDAGKRYLNPPNEYSIRQLTFQWLNSPYQWGGRTMFGVDCSGFVQVNFKMMGIDLPRDAWQQAQEGQTIKKLKQAVCGDLAFFDDKEEIVHVGILLGTDKIIHASGKVRIDDINEDGIFHSETAKQTHSLKVIKRCC